jgi:hypothetical protein
LLRPPIILAAPARFLINVDKPRGEGDDPLESEGNLVTRTAPQRFSEVKFGLMDAPWRDTETGVSPWTMFAPTAA